MKDLKTNLEDLKKRVQKFCEDRGWDEPHNPKDLAIGVITEASELLEIFRFHEADAVKDLIKDKQTRQQISDELADIMCFLLRFAQMYDFDITQCLEDKLAKNAIRYPADN